MGQLAQRIEAWRLIRRTRSEIPKLRDYAVRHCPPEVVRQFRARRGSRLALAVVGGYPFLGYVRLGYDWKAAYYNPYLLFDEVHYFQNRFTPPLVFDLGYPFHVHWFGSAEDVVRICRAHQVGLVRAYDPANGQVAVEAAQALRVPAVVSVH
jgi:hypothetical protein